MPTPVEYAGGALRRAVEFRERLRDRRIADIAALERDREPGPLFSIVMPVYDPPRQWLEAAVASVRAQTYPRWQLCIADDASRSPWVAPYLEQLSRDARIDHVVRPRNGHISQASNSALELAVGDYAVLLDNDDLLSPVALTHLALHLRRHPDDVVVYSDEDKVGEDGRRYGPYRKPDWNPDLLLSHNYVSHLGAYRLAELRRLGGFREGFEGSQDHDLALRMAAASDGRVGHIPYVLYHWRALASSAASGEDVKPYAVTAGVAAVQEAVGDAFEVGYRVGPQVQGYALHARGPDAPDVHTERVRGRDFGAAVRRASRTEAGHVLFLDDNVELTAPAAALATGAALLSRPGVAAVGGAVLDLDGRLADGALWTGERVRGRNRGPVVAWRGLAPAERPGPNGRPGHVQTVTALSSSLLLTTPAILRAVGEHLDAGSWADVQWCLLAGRRGLRCVWLPELTGVVHGRLAPRRRADLSRLGDLTPAALRRDPQAPPAMSRWDPRYEPAAFEDARGIEAARRGLMGVSDPDGRRRVGSAVRCRSRLPPPA